MHSLANTSYTSVSPLYNEVTTHLLELLWEWSDSTHTKQSENWSSKHGATITLPPCWPPPPYWNSLPLPALGCYLVQDFACCCCSVTKSCPALFDPMNCRTPGFSALRYLPEFVQTQVHWVSDAIQPFHPTVAPFSCPQSFPASRSRFYLPIFFLITISYFYFP